MNPPPLEPTRSPPSPPQLRPAQPGSSQRTLVPDTRPPESRLRKRQDAAERERRQNLGAAECLARWLTEGAEQRRQGEGVERLSHDLAAGRHVVHQPAGLSVWGVHGAQEAPGLGQELPHGRGPHFGERRPSVHAAEVRQVADEVELVGDHAEACVLQHAEAFAQRQRERTFFLSIGACLFVCLNLWTFLSRPVFELRFPVASRYSKALDSGAVECKILIM